MDDTTLKAASVIALPDTAFPVVKDDLKTPLRPVEVPTAVSCGSTITITTISSPVPMDWQGDPFSSSPARYLNLSSPPISPARQGSYSHQLELQVDLSAVRSDLVNALGNHTSISFHILQALNAYGSLGVELVHKLCNAREILAELAADEGAFFDQLVEDAMLGKDNAGEPKFLLPASLKDLNFKTERTVAKNLMMEFLAVQQEAKAKPGQ